MQLFILHPCPIEAARLLCDTHLTSQGKETPQILYTAAHNVGAAITEQFAIPGVSEPVNPWNPVWVHPCVDWAASGISAFKWTLQHGLAIADEFEKRYGHKFRSYYHLKHIESYLDSIADKLPPNPCGGFGWLDTLPARAEERITPRLCFDNAPTGVGYGVVAMDPEFVVPSADGYPNCAESYRKFYAHKAKRKFVMRWNRQSEAPELIKTAFRVYFPDVPLLTARPAKPAKPASLADTTLEDVVEYLEATSKRKKTQSVG